MSGQDWLAITTGGH